MYPGLKYWENEKEKEKKNEEKSNGVFDVPDHVSGTNGGESYGGAGGNTVFGRLFWCGI